MMTTDSSQPDSILFEELDKQSIGLRVAAGDLLAVLIKIENKPKEFTDLINILKKMQTIDIQNMDDVLFELNKNLLLASVKVNEDSSSSLESIKLDQLILLEFMEKSDALVSQAMELFNKADALAGKG